MVDSQEIIERSIYCSILNVAKELGFTVDPNEYLPINTQNQQRFKEDISKLTKYIQIFGTGNNQSKDIKLTPRIVVNAKGFYPGNIGLPRQLIEKEEGVGFTVTEEPYETIDQYIDVHLVANNQDDLRLLHKILFWSIPQRGYVKPYNQQKFLFSGNIFVELVNFFDIPNLELGLMEKVYEFLIQDTLVLEKAQESYLVPIVDINLLLADYNENIHVNNK
jgi:hypothetical protein|nr:MAG TPA: hypothetical protein [Caudoviricetes sp.]